MAIFHVWFSTKHRKWLLQGDVLEAARQLIRETSMRHRIHLIEAEAIVNHVHLLLELEDESQLASAMHLIKGASARRLFQRFPELKLDAKTASFWQAGYASKLVAPNALATTSLYIRSQWDRLEKYDL